MTHLDADHAAGSLAKALRGWEPEDDTAVDDISREPSSALVSCLTGFADLAPLGNTLPPAWHWLHFLTWPPSSVLGPDGHPAAGTFLPPIPDRRRMFAGGRVEIVEPIAFDRPARRTQSLAGVEIKTGRSGDLAFVTVRSEIVQDGRLRVREDQELVYRSGDPALAPATEPAAAGPAPVDAARSPADRWAWQLRSDPRLLFRFSALTANTHRIHYDKPYATGVEGFPGLVVHGPLLVLLMAELVRAHAPDRQMRSMSFRLRKPVFLDDAITVAAQPDDGGVRVRVGTTGNDQHATADVRLAT